MAIVDSTNNQFRDHSDFYFPHSDGGLVSIQCFFSGRSDSRQRIVLIVTVGRGNFVTRESQKDLCEILLFV